MGEEIQPIYVDLASETDDPHVTVIPSLCMACHEMVSVMAERGRRGGGNLWSGECCGEADERVIVGALWEERRNCKGYCSGLGDGKEW